MHGIDRWNEAREALGFPRRDAQDRLFSGVVEAVEAGETAFGQGPCGAGKSLIVVPMSAYIGELGRVIHSSFTKAQQAQMSRDGLRLVDLGIFTDCVEVRGRSEYVCLRRWRKSLGHVEYPAGDGLRSEFPDLTDDQWRSVRSDSDAGCGAECGELDYANIARARARTPGALVVVNHSILALDFHLKGSTDSGPLVGYSPDDVLVLDEAHQAPDAFRSALGKSITPTRLRRLATLAAIEVGHNAGRQGPDAFEHFLGRLVPGERERFSFAYLSPEDWGGHWLDVALEWVREIGWAGREAELRARTEDEAASGRRVARVAGAILADLREAERSLGDDDLAAWVERDGPKLEVRPLDVSDFSRDLLRHGTAAVATSATVAGYPMTELGGGRLIQVESPFDLARQRIAVTTSNERKDDEPRRLADLLTLVDRAEGGVLVLAATNRVNIGGRWRSAADLCVETLRQAGYRVGQQHSPADVPALVEGLRSGELDVVVATASMREGIDLKGSALSMVILYGLPWPYMGDPLLNARIRKVGEARKWSLTRPMMLVNLEQAIGRLIRDEEDFGYVALLDGSERAVQTFAKMTHPSVLRVIL